MKAACKTRCDRSSSGASFIDLCIRTRGPLDAELVKVDLFHLTLAHKEGKSEMIQLTTSEEYVWRIIDMMNRIIEASSEVGGYNLVLVEDERHGGEAAARRGVLDLVPSLDRAGLTDRAGQAEAAR